MLNKLFNRYNKTIAILGSDTNVDIYRPDYTTANQTGTLVASNISSRNDTRAQAWAEPSIQGGMYYDIFIDRRLVKPGDILIPTGTSPTAQFSTGEIITILSLSGLKPCVGLLTDCIGKITDTVNETIYGNVRWNWSSPGTPKAGLNRTIEDSMPFDRRKLIMYRRQGQGLPTPLMKDMRFVQTIDGLDYWWRIVDVLSTGNETQCQVEEDNT